jgi:hypothetical protein
MHRPINDRTTAVNVKPIARQLLLRPYSLVSPGRTLTSGDLNISDASSHAVGRSLVGDEDSRE